MTDNAAAALNYAGAAATGTVVFGFDPSQWTVIFGGIGAMCAIGGLTIQFLRFRRGS